MDEAPEWMISFGKQFQICVIVLIQVFIVAELVMYIILFKEMYDHNKELQNMKSLGLSKGRYFAERAKLCLRHFWGAPGQNYGFREKIRNQDKKKTTINKGNNYHISYMRQHKSILDCNRPLRFKAKIHIVFLFFM